MESLAHFLGTDRPATSREDPLAHPEKLTAAEFADAVLNSQEFRSFIVSKLTLGDLPAPIVLRLMDYAPQWGKPVERVEVDDRRVDPASLTTVELESRISVLQSLVQELKKPAASILH